MAESAVEPVYLRCDYSPKNPLNAWIESNAKHPRTVEILNEEKLNSLRVHEAVEIRTILVPSSCRIRG